MSASPQDCGPSVLFCTNYDEGPEPSWVPSGEAQAWYDSCETRSLEGRAFRAAHSAGARETHVRHFIDLPTPLTSGTLYARIYSYVPSEVVLPNFLTVIALWELPRFHTAESSLAILAGDTIGVSSNIEAPDNAALGTIQRDRWQCLELEIELDDINGSIRAYVDGEQVVSRSGFDSLPDGGINTIVSGVAFPALTSDVEILLDDFLVATARVGCSAGL